MFDPLARAVAEPGDGRGGRGAYQRDRERIVFSRAFRRLAHKTQVFIAPEGDHFRTRLTHTLEVASISRAVARRLSLDEDLTEAIATGHDLGHPPFGHAGEAALHAARHAADGGAFRHNEQSVRIVEVLERRHRPPLDGVGVADAPAGLNLTAAVRDGIRHHTGPGLPATREGQIVRTIDRVAYINHDIDDAVRAGELEEAGLPTDAIAVLGHTAGARIDALVADMVAASEGAPQIAQTARVGEAMLALRRFMFERVYFGVAVREEAERAQGVVSRLYAFYLAHPGEVPDEATPAADPAQRAADWVAGMTDRYALADHRRRFEPGEAPGATRPRWPA